MPKHLNPKVAANILENMSGKERALLIKDYIRQEALYREALSLGLDQEDYIIRTRMVQKMEFLSDMSATTTPIETAELRSYYEAHKQNYRASPTVSFAHIFVSTKNKPLVQAKVEAIDFRKFLTQKKLGFDAAVQYGDRFLYHTNYIDRGYGFIQSHFGANIADSVFSENPPPRRMVGSRNFRTRRSSHLYKQIQGGSNSTIFRFKNSNYERHYCRAQARFNRSYGT